MSRKFDSDERSGSFKTVFYAISKDGLYKEELEDFNKALEVRNIGKYNFHMKNSEQPIVEMECSVYEKRVETIRSWKKL